MYNTRMMSHFELSDKLKSLNRSGVDVPRLNPSNFIPEYVETKNGVEVYSHGGRQLKVPSGHVIDSHGNVVNIEGLNRQMHVEISKLIEIDFSSRNDRHKDIFGLRMPSDRPIDAKYDVTTFF